MRTIKVTRDTQTTIAIDVDGARARACYTQEVVEDLKEYHGVDISREIGLALLQEVDMEFDLDEDEKAFLINELNHHLSLERL